MDEIKFVREEVINCTKCDLCQTRIKAVPGKGDIKSEVVFVGEAPGRNEDKQGEPFVGVAGKKLTSALAKIGISRDNIYITNVIKCRPPKNRIPSKIEKETCWNYLERELSIIQPRIICIMGNTAYESILGGSEITKNRGKVIRKNGFLYFLTIHPAAAIYNKELQSVLEKDLKKLFEIIEQLKNGTNNVEIIENSS